MDVGEVLPDLQERKTPVSCDPWLRQCDCCEQI